MLHRAVRHARRLLTSVFVRPNHRRPKWSRLRPLEALEDRTVPTGVVTIALGANAQEGISNGSFILTRTGDISQSASVTVGLSGSGTATPGQDFQYITGNVTFQPNSATATVPVNVIGSPYDDATYEPDETVVLNIMSGGGSLTIGSPSSATVTITDNDAPPEVTVANLNDTIEGGTPGAFRFTRTGSTSQPLTVTYTIDGSATPGSDYTALSGSVTIQSGWSYADVAVSPIDDAIAEYDENVDVTIQNGTGYAIGTPDSATVIIRDNEQPVVMVEWIADATEGSDSGWYAFSRMGDKTNALTVNFAVSGTATSGNDYTSIGTSVTIPATANVENLEVAALADGIYDPDETVIVTLQNGAGYAIDSQNNVATITVFDVAPGGVSGAVWADTDEDGSWGSGESGLSGAVVSLLDANGDSAKDADGNTVAPITTGTDGAYSFTNLYPSGYTVQIISPSGYVLNGSGNTLQQTVVVNSDQTTTLNVPAYTATQASSISGAISVYQDSGDTGGPGLAGVSVTLLDGNGAQADDANGNPVPAVTTDSTGAYTFSNLLPGTYTAQFAAPGGYLFSTSDQANWSEDVSTPGPDSVLNGEAYQPATVSGTAWVDADQNGLFDAGESSRSGVTVELLTLDWDTVATASTAADGSYSFNGLAPGSYQIRFTAPSGYVLDGDSDSLSRVFTVGTGGAITQNIAAFAVTQLVLVSGSVWVDLDGNGIKDTGEIGLYGVSAEVLDSTGHLVDSTSTDSDGNFAVSGLSSGTYTVQFTAPAGYLLSPSHSSTWATEVGTPGPDAMISAGAYQPASANGTVWIDTDSDGIKDVGESAIDAANVTFYGSDGESAGTATADANGSFSVSNLPPDVYRVSVDAPAGYPLNGMPSSVWVPLTLTSGGSATVPVAYNNAAADKNAIKFEAVAGKELFDEINARLAQKSKVAQQIVDEYFKGHMGIDPTKQGDKTKWAKEKVIYGVVKNQAGARVSGGAGNGVQMAVDDFQNAPQKDKACIIQSLEFQFVFFDAAGKTILEKPLTLYQIEGIAVDANGKAKGIDFHLLTGPVGFDIDGKTVAKVEITTKVTSGWGTYKDMPQPKESSYFYPKQIKAPPKDVITWLGKTTNYQFRWTIDSANGKWTWNDSSIGVNASGTDNTLNK